MRKYLRLLFLVLITFFGLSKLAEWYLENKFESLINYNPDRAYDIVYADFDLHTFFRGITLDDVAINPVNKAQGTIVQGKVDYADLSGFAWQKFLFSRNLKVDEIRFVSPVFDVIIVEDSIQKKNKSGTSLQALFSDILSRADLSRFGIEGGSMQVKKGDSTLIGSIQNIDILASEIETDSLQLTHIIPFKLGNLEVGIDSMFYQINPYTKAKITSVDYNIKKEHLVLNELALEYDKDWVAISEQRGIQDDVMEFYLKSLIISGIDFSSSFWTDLDIVAKSMEIDSLKLSMKRNKNLPRPAEVAKPLFKGMIDKIPYRVDLDSIKISNSSLSYGELSVDKQQTGIIEISDINGCITQLSTFPEQQTDREFFEAKLNARLNNAALMYINLQVPYQNDQFILHTSLSDLDMTVLSPSLMPLLGVEIKEGQLHNLDYRMNASYYQSTNKLQMDYENLHLSIYKEQDDGSEHKKAFLSSIANVAIRHHNMPENKGYISASYTTQRNIYRSPFQHIVAGVLDGAKHIVPAKGIQNLINKTPKEEKVQKREERRYKRNKKRETRQ
jgi:hypothetical protein